MIDYENQQKQVRHWHYHHYQSVFYAQFQIDVLADTNDRKVDNLDLEGYLCPHTGYLCPDQEDVTKKVDNLDLEGCLCPDQEDVTKF